MRVLPRHLQAPDWLQKAKGRNPITVGKPGLDKKKGEAKPNWSGQVALKKTERKTTSEQEGAKVDFRGQLKKSGPKSPAPDRGAAETRGEPEWKKVSLRSTPKGGEE